MKEVRCAIYTRKSSEEGLEQDFNSLHAQREACAAYVLSQASEGWTLLPQVYDDGGISGGTLERPALQELLADIAAGKIDIVVVYKVDRLTRSLLDFAKLVEAFDSADTSFVSITQSFNTTTSMGRLTLNMLLSFAQFEREVTAERIRDKLAASKAKGMWMGGVPPLGYKADGRSLAVVEPHAEVIRGIYARYRRLGNVRELQQELAGEGVMVPKRKTGSGKALGGGPFSRGQLYAILRSPIYVGEIPHRDKTYPGNHAALIACEEWDAVQRQLTSHVKGVRKSGRPPTASLLAGKLFDGEGEPIIASHTTKRGKRYRYYVSKALNLGNTAMGLRLPALEVERAAAHALAELFDDPLGLAERAGVEIPPDKLKRLAASAKQTARDLRDASKGLGDLLARVEVRDNGLSLVVCCEAVADTLDIQPSEGTPAVFTHVVAVRLTRTGRAIRLVQNSGGLAVANGEADTALLRLIARAQAWWAVLNEGDIEPSTLAEREGVTTSWVIRTVRLAFLSPRVVDGILAGRVRAGVDATQLLRSETISLDWEEQEKRLLAG